MSRYVKKFDSVLKATSSNEIVSPNISRIIEGEDKRCYFKRTVKDAQLKISGTSLNDLYYEQSYDVTTNLTEYVVNSNPAPQVSYRCSYDSDLLANNHRVVIDVVVKMNDVDITGTAYDEATGHIHIDSINGPLYIEADSMEDYLCITSATANVQLKFYRNGTLTRVPVFEYSTDKGQTWTEISPSTSSTYTDILTLTNVGDKVWFRGDNPNGLGANVSSSYNPNGYIRFTAYNNYSSGQRINVSGDINSLISKTDFYDYDLSSIPNCFAGLFSSAGIIDASKLRLTSSSISNGCYNNMFDVNYFMTAGPATIPDATTKPYCYNRMFSRCYKLTSAPVMQVKEMADHCCYQMFYQCYAIKSLPDNMITARTMAPYCCASMFYECTGLTTAPELHSNKLANYCYQSMFYGCTKLVNIPTLPALNLQPYCYNNMFGKCTSLTTLPTLPASVMVSNCYSSMFYGCTGLTSIPENYLNNTILADSCYYSMFSSCTGLTSVPVLTNMNLAPQCYRYLFASCTGLTTVPTNMLPATTLKGWCYGYMFNKCTNLTNAPIIPAAVMPDNCCWSMFEGCTSLTTVPTNMLPATTVGKWSYYYMFKGCTSLTVAPELPITKFTSTCGCQSMFEGCTNLTTAPSVLPATTLADSCYSSMFSGCSKLSSTPSLPATTLATYCYSNMFAGTNITSVVTLPDDITLANGCFGSMYKNCKGITTVPTDYLPYTNLQSYCYQYMFSDCSNLTNAPTLPATTLSTYCYQYMFQNCTSLTTAPELPATTLVDYCYKCMFQGCTSLTTAPELLTTTLLRECYSAMFNGCSSLNSIKCLAIDISASNCTSSWVNGVSATGTFVKHPKCNWTSGTSGMPSSWTIQDDAIVYIDGVETKMSAIQMTQTYREQGYTAMYISPYKNASEEASIYSVLDRCPIGGDFVYTFEPQNAIYTLNVTATTDSTVAISNLTYANLYASKNGGNIYKLTVSTHTTESLSTGDTFAVMGYNPAGSGSWKADPSQSPKFTVTGGITLSGDLAGMYSASTHTTVIPASMPLAYMFYNCTALTSAAGLTCTADTIECEQWGYHMFDGCTKLVDGPSLLGSTTISKQCYYYMFRGCSALTSAPEISATTLNTEACGYMFCNCTSLVTAMSTLPAMTLADGCYYYMFYYCTALTTPPTLPATTLATNCYNRMFYGCKALVTAPVLPAETLVSGCYNSMFCQCNNLTTITCLSSTGGTKQTTSYWTYYVNKSGTFYRKPGVSWVKTTDQYYGAPLSFTITDYTEA